MANSSLTPDPAASEPSFQLAKTTAIKLRQVSFLVIPLLLLILLLTVLLGRIEFHMAVPTTLIPLLGGSFGGLMYAIRSSPIALPAISDKSVFPGFVTDWAFGVAGGYVVFLLLPGQFVLNTDSEAIKFFATTVLGGYAGRALISKMLNEKILNEKVEELGEKISVLSEVEEGGRRRREYDQAFAFLVTQQLNGENPCDFHVLCESAHRASVQEWERIFLKVQDFRLQNHETPTKVDRSVPVFQALANTDYGKTHHAVHGDLAKAFSQKTKPDLVEAEKQIREAMRLRDIYHDTGFLFYEFLRAKYLIMMDAKYLKGKPSASNIRATIEDCLNRANTGAPKESIAKSDTIQRWLQINEVKLATDVA